IPYAWGAPEAERRAAFPCDGHLVPADEAVFRAVDVDAPAAVVFRWLCQLRVAPYSYDWIDNFGRQSPPQLTPGLDDLQRGQTVMGVFELVDFERDRHLTAVTRPSVADCVARIHLVDERGNVHRGAAAGREVLRRLPGGTLWTLPFLVPGALRLAERAYVWIAHRWGPLGAHGNPPPPSGCPLGDREA